MTFNLRVGHSSRFSCYSVIPGAPTEVLWPCNANRRIAASVLQRGCCIASSIPAKPLANWARPTQVAYGALIASSLIVQPAQASSTVDLLGFFLTHPFWTLGGTAVLYFIIPRIIKLDMEVRNTYKQVVSPNSMPRNTSTQSSQLLRPADTSVPQKPSQPRPALKSDSSSDPSKSIAASNKAEVSTKQGRRLQALANELDADFQVSRLAPEGAVPVRAQTPGPEKP